jgi:DNA modification methylase
MIETHTVPGDVVLDLFAGSGNVSAVAKRMGRGFVAVEWDKPTVEKLSARLL